jgi:ABC-type transport system involved in multi-copper enzyme maturation permease subunit
MFYLLLIVTFLVALLVCFVVSRLFNDSIYKILNLIVPEAINEAWLKYIKFAIYVVGISGGVRVWDLEKYITSRYDNREIVQLTTERWTLEIYRTLIGSLQSIATVLLIFFVFTLVAYVVIRIFASRNEKKE